ncbi:MAG: acyltransferase [Chloroflexales bacterium]
MNKLSPPDRRYDLDWLRVLAIALIFLFHSTRAFDNYLGWHVKNNQLSDVFLLPALIGSLWMMPLFFVLSGAATCFSLRSRPVGSFIQTRFLRLGVPLITLGWFVLSPPQVYIERITTRYNTPAFAGSFLAYLPHYLEGVYGSGGNFALEGLHLWYLYWLLLFSLIALPLFMALNGIGGRRLIGAMAAVVARPGGIFLFALPLCLAEVTVRLGIAPNQEDGGWFIVTYFFLMMNGFVLAADERFGLATERHRWPALVLAIALPTALVWLFPGQLMWWEPTSWPLAGVLKATSCWLVVVAMLGFGRAHLNVAHPYLRYASELALPFYILHQPIIVFLAYGMRNWELGIATKLLILITSACAVTVLLYVLLVRRFNGLRFLFGMSLLPRGTAVTQQIVQQ